MDWGEEISRAQRARWVFRVKGGKPLGASCTIGMRNCVAHRRRSRLIQLPLSGGNVRETVVFGGQEGLTFDLDGGPIIAHLHEPAEKDRYVFDVAWRKDFGMLRGLCQWLS